MTNWPARHAAIVVANGEEWDRLSEAYDADWKAEYTRAFIEHALSRPGWDRENAEVWAGEMVDSALIEHSDRDPAGVASADVIVCEAETANA